MIKDKGSSEYRGTLFYKKMMMRHLIPSSLFLVDLPYPFFFSMSSVAVASNPSSRYSARESKAASSVWPACS